MKYAKNKKGLTIVELLVAMTIFLVVISIAVGGFVSLIRLQTQSQVITDVQQNARISLEQVTRLSRQADKVEIKTIDSLRDSLVVVISGNTACFGISGEERLVKYNSHDSSGCTGSDLTLTDSAVKITKFKFERSNNVPPSLSIHIIVEAANPSGSSINEDKIELNTSVVLAGLD